MSSYPATWPKPDPKRPDCLASRMTEQDRVDLYERRITTRALAKKYGVHERHVSFMYPGKKPLVDQAKLALIRKEFKLAVAKEVLEGKYTSREASNKAHVSYNTMLRFVAKAKKLHPELAKTYEAAKHR